MDTKKVFNNDDLNWEIEKIKAFDAPVLISKEFDNNLEYPYAIDIEDESYFYSSEEERDEDYERLRTVVPQFHFFSKCK